MPKRKPVEKEEEIEVKEQPKKETFATRWFKDYATNNATELKIVCDLTSRAAEEMFYMVLPSKNTEVYAVIFYATFQTILEFIRSQQSKWKQFTIEIANSINIGYSNSTDEENEKVGNFFPIMEYIGINRKIIDPEKLDKDRTSSNCIKWKELNIKSNIKFYKDMQETAYNKLYHEYRTDIRTSEAIFPLFCIFIDNIVSVMKLKFKELEGTDISEVSMNVFGLFDVYYSFNADDNQEIIEYRPNIGMKLALKNDSAATRD